MPESDHQPRGVVMESQAQADDIIVLDRIRSGDCRAYEMVMRRYNQRLFRVARSILRSDDMAQDAVQEAYVTAFYKLDKYEPTGSFGAWLTRIAVNEALMIKRKNHRFIREDTWNVSVNGAQEGEQPAEMSDPEDRVANAELARLIERAVDGLPEDYRTVFVLRDIQQLSIKETAESMGVNEATIKSRLFRARNLMQQMLDKYISAAGMEVFEFAGKRCDRMVSLVLRKLRIQ